MARHWLIRLGVTAMFCLMAGCGGSDDPITPANPDDPIDPDDPDPTPIEQVKLVDHTVLDAFPSIPDSVFSQVDADLSLYYGHTSHGRQLMTGLTMLAAEFPACEGIPHVTEAYGDLGDVGDLTWEQTTRAFLEANGHDYNVVIWSWCGGCSDNTPAGIDIYLNAMNQLELDYPAHTFIYMTGHLDGTGTGGTLYASNNHIRDYCATNDKWLFDFADVESYDPDGNYYPDGSDDCGWCSTWCTTHSCPACASCAHSHCFNCYLKGKAFWWMMARVAGWEPSA